MDLSSLRALVRNLNFSAFGQDVTVDLDPAPVATRGIWLTPETDDQPGGLELHRRDRSYVLAVPILTVPHRAIVYAAASPAWADQLEPPPSPGEILRWQVDGFPQVEADHARLRLVLAPEIPT